MIPQTVGTVGTLHRGIMDPVWLRWVKRLQARAQARLTYATDEYDAGRYELVREVAAEILAAGRPGSSKTPAGCPSSREGPGDPQGGRAGCRLRRRQDTAHQGAR